MNNIFIPSIKFSNHYEKLHNQTTAKLIHVEEININDRTSLDFINYDTKSIDGSIYPLKKGRYLLLCFLGCKNIPFTTVRSYRAEKEKYYKDNLNKTFNIIVSPCWL